MVMSAGGVLSQWFGFHDQGAQTLTLGGQEKIELETERIAINPPYDGAVHAERPGMVRKVQGELELHARLNRRFGFDPAAGRRDVMDPCFPSKTLRSRKVQMAIQVCPPGASGFGSFQLFVHPKPLPWSIRHSSFVTPVPVKKGTAQVVRAHHPEIVPRKRGTPGCVLVGSSCIQAHRN